VAVNVLSPTASRIIEQLPSPPDSAMVHVAFAPLTLIVTLPVGVPAPDVTRTPTVTVPPLIDGSGRSEVMVVVVPAGGGGGAAVTVWASVSELPASPGVPAYVAVRVRSPAVDNESWQLPAPFDNAAVQLWTPSPTVTFPAGVGPSDATRKLTVNGVPTCDGSGKSPVIVVVVPMAETAVALEVTAA
jgi:hypothetical protein